MKKFLFLLFIFSSYLCFVNAEVTNFVENQNDLAIKMIYVEGGTFKMGNKSDKKREYDEENVHSVTLDDFFIGETEITVAQFAKFVEETNYTTSAEQQGQSYVWDNKNAVMVLRKNVSWRCDESGDLIDLDYYNNFPVVFISWNDATEFCKWLSKKTGKNYTLPTEAEWEFAASGGNHENNYIYSGSNKIKEVAWYYNSARKKIHPIASKLHNQLGIYDMSGSVYEWCQDWYDSKYPLEDQINPTGPTNKFNTLFRRVIRGGSWLVFKEFCRITNRDSGDPNLGVSTSGFRIVCRKK